MKYLVALLLACSLLAGPAGLGQERPKPVSLIQLIANPEKFDGTLVTVRGFLVRMGAPHDMTAHVLYLHKEDGDNLLDSSVLIVQSEQMIRDQEKIDRMYVTLTGTFRAVRTANDSYAPQISDIQVCTPWSDPNHPIGLKGDNKKHK